MSYLETTDHTRLFYDDHGNGDPVVFVHGWSLSSQIWKHQIGALTTAGLRCVVYDRRGHGRSSQPSGGYDFDTLADDLAALIDHLDLRGVTLVGHSMGAGEIARYLSRHGAGRVARVMLVAPVTPCLGKRADNPAGLDASFFEALLGAMAADRPGFLRAGVPSFIGAAATDDVVEWAFDIAMQASPIATSACVRAYSTTDFRPEMAAFTMPTLVVHGDDDMSAPLELTGRPTAAAIAGSELRIYEGAPHALFLTDSERFNRDVVSFVRSDATS